jgi:hypothetical protein
LTWSQRVERILAPRQRDRHLSRDDWVDDCLADMLARGYAEAGRTRSNTPLVLGSK